MSTQTNISNEIISNYSGHFVEKSVSELVTSFINERKDKSLSGIVFGISMLIGADLAKTIMLDLVRGQKKQISDEILEITKYFNILQPIKYSFGLISYGFNLTSDQFNGLFRTNSVSIDNTNNLSNEIVYTLEISNLFLSNLIKYIEDKKNNCMFVKINDTNLII